MPKTPPKNNPYSKAASTYGSNAQKHTGDPREVEARVLLKAAKGLQELQDNWDDVMADKDILHDTLLYNHKIWLMFYDTAIENPEDARPNDLRSNIINLANFIFKREIEIKAAPKKEKLDALISINKEIAGGLREQQKANKGEQSDAAQNPSEENKGRGTSFNT